MESKWQGARGIAGIERDQRRRPRWRWKWRSDTGDERRGWGGVEEGEEADEELEGVAGSFYSRGEGWPSRAPPSMSVHGSAGRNSHGGAREGDEEGQDKQQRLTETRGAQERKEEADKGEEDDDGGATGH